MASVHSLPADQRAVLQLVLQRGRSYDDIAQLLSIDRGAVRERALAALDALGPETAVSPQRRALITDYLLGQLPPRVSDDTRDHLAQSDGERAWARVIASELEPITSRPLPEILGAAPRVGAEPQSEPAAQARDAAPAPARDAAPAPARDAAPAGVAPAGGGMRGPGSEEPHPASQRGGSTLLALGALIVVVVVVIVIATNGSGSKHNSPAARPPTTTAASTPTTSGTAGGARILSRFSLLSPAKGARAAGIAEVLRQGNATAIAIIAQGLTPNTGHDAYAVWVYNSHSDDHLLGFVNPNVGANGRLQTVGPLPANAGKYKLLLVTLETQRNPPGPGRVVLQGTLTGVP